MDDPVCRQMEERIVGYCDYVGYDADDGPRKPDAQPRRRQRRLQAAAVTLRTGCRSGRKEGWKLRDA